MVLERRGVEPRQTGCKVRQGTHSAPHEESLRGNRSEAFLFALASSAHEPNLSSYLTPVKPLSDKIKEIAVLTSVPDMIPFI